MSVPQIFVYKMKWVFFFYRYVKKNNSPTPRDILQPEGKEIQHIKAIEEYPPLMESDGWGDCWEQLPPRDGRLPLFPIVRRKQEHSDGVAHSLIYIAVAYSCYIIDDHPPHIDLSIFRVARPPWPRAFNNRLIYFFSFNSSSTELLSRAWAIVPCQCGTLWASYTPSEKAGTFKI